MNVLASSIAFKAFGESAEVVLPLPPGYVPPPHMPRASAPTRPALSRSNDGAVEVKADRDGQFRIDIEIDGTNVRALVDTGATFVALTAEDARRLDIDPPASAFIVPVRTANGTAKFAHVRLRQIAIGDITVNDIDAVVAPPGATHISLLGMSFLRKLRSFQVDDGRLLMNQ
jgi:aspartyl protease family protein